MNAVTDIYDQEVEVRKLEKENKRHKRRIDELLNDKLLEQRWN